MQTWRLTRVLVVFTQSVSFAKIAPISVPPLPPLVLVAATTLPLHSLQAALTAALRVTISSPTLVSLPQVCWNPIKYTNQPGDISVFVNVWEGGGGGIIIIQLNFTFSWFCQGEGATILCCFVMKRKKRWMIWAISSVSFFPSSFLFVFVLFLWQHLWVIEWLHGYLRQAVTE